MNIKNEYGNISSENPYRILLLTNIDSDNIGYQIIEACDTSILHSIMGNLHIPTNEYSIISRPEGIVSKKYVATKNPELLCNADSAIRNCDLIVVGGAPLFNYKYQIFYERTATILDLAKKHNKPVIFSAIGIDSYDEDNEKCQRLKKTLNFDNVKQITTRDGLEYLEQYRERSTLPISKVADPAVVCSSVFRKYIHAEKHTRKKIGIVVIRANAFVANNVSFTKEDSAALWTDLVHLLDKQGYDYELLTSGHFGDELFLDYLIRYHNISEKKCVFNMNSPEQLMAKLSSYDGIITCRLHPSIISYSLGIPSVSLTWNSKVTAFYDMIGYPERSLTVENFSAKKILNQLEQAMEEGVQKNPDYIYTIYESLFYALERELHLTEENITPYSLKEIYQHLPDYPGTSAEYMQTKLLRKFRRIYDNYTILSDKNKKNEQTVKDLKTELKQLRDNPPLWKNIKRKIKNILKKILKKIM